MGELLQPAPVDHVAGSAVSAVPLLVCARPPLRVSWNQTVPLPAGERNAIQYLAPAVIGTAGTLTEFQAPAVGLVIVPCVRSAPGLSDIVLAYSPTFSVLA